MFPGAVEVFSIVGKAEGVHGGFDLIAEVDFLFVEFYVFQDNFVHVIFGFGRVVLGGSVFGFADFFISGSNYRFIVVGIEEGVNLVKGLS
jgi:hypothetical protein